MFMSPRVLITDKDRIYKTPTVSYGCLTNPNPYTKSKIAYKIAYKCIGLIPVGETIANSLGRIQ